MLESRLKGLNFGISLDPIRLSLVVPDFGVENKQKKKIKTHPNTSFPPFFLMVRTKIASTLS